MGYNEAMNTQTDSSTIKINLPPGIKNNAQEEAKRIGISLQDFIRMLMATYFARGNSVSALSRDMQLLERAREDIRKGRYTTIRTQAELKKHLDSL